MIFTRLTGPTSTMVSNGESWYARDKVIDKSSVSNVEKASCGKRVLDVEHTKSMSTLLEVPAWQSTQSHTKINGCDQKNDGNPRLDGSSGLLALPMFSLVWIMPPRMRTQSAGRPATESLRGGTGGRGLKKLMVGVLGDVNGNVLRSQWRSTWLLDDHCPTIAEPLTHHASSGCSYKEFLACNPKEYDGKALTWWNSQIRTLSREVVVSMSWNDFKFMMIQEFCPSHEMQKLESELWNHAMVGAGHAAYTDRFHELARLVPHLVTPESRMIERYVYGLALQIRRMVAATEPKTIQKAVQISGALTDEAVRNGSIKRLRKGNMGNLARIRMVGMIIRGLGLGMLLLLL
ncbi:reverse transcriptase domain-containing protein [Tanacetum coccineum]